MTETSTTEMLDVGKHCAYCNRLDFLPFLCPLCRKHFCLEHRNSHGSQCPGSLSAARDRVLPQCPLCHQYIPVEPHEDPNTKVWAHIDQGCSAPQTTKTRMRCSLPGCKGSEAVPVICPQCHNHFCFSHRFPSDHHCSSQRPSSLMSVATKKPATSPSSSSSSSPPSATTPNAMEKKREKFVELQAQKKQAASSLWHKVETMKARAKATGDAKVPYERRAFFEVLFPMDSGVAPKSLFFDIQWSVGKVLDKAADAGGVINKNYMPGAPQLVLIAVLSGTKLDNSQTLESLLISKLIQPGDPLLLEFSDVLINQQ